MLNEKRTGLRRVILWALVAAYTIALPDANVVYEAIATHFSLSIARKVPIALIILFGVIYILFGLMTKKSARYFGLLSPCFIIVYAVISLEPNPNKHIHIPEYIVMTWLLYAVFSDDYQGNGLFVFIFICSSMLGIVDELEQGIYPSRFYGWIDMCINSASSIIGALILYGIKKTPSGGWAWARHLKTLKGPVGAVIYGVIGAVLMCWYLFDVRTKRIFWSVYPYWLLGLNGIFLALGPVVVFLYWRRFRELSHLKDKENRMFYDEAVTANLWVFSPLTILFVMHTLVLFIAFSGMEFR